MDNGSFLPLIPLRGALLFPDTSGNFDIGREKSVVAAQEAFAAGGFILFASQKDDRNMDPAFSDLRETATIAKILSLSPSGNKALRVHAEGVRRVSLLQKDAPDGQNYLSAYFSEIEMTNSDEIGSMAYRKNLFLILDELSMYHNGVTREGLSMIRNASDETVVNSAATLLTIRDAYPILAETDIYRRYEFLTDALIYEMEVVKAEKKINIKVKHSLEKAQKDHILREQMRIISDELDDSGDREFQKKIALIDAPDEVKEKLTKDLQRLKKISAMSPEYSILTEYIEYSTELPWRKCSEEIHDLIYAKNILDRDHYGLTKVKERILEYIAVHNLTRSFRSPILCFIGPPGVGKTSIARSVAEATGRKFVRMSLGGISDEAEIRGHRKTYVAAMAGRILNGIKQVGVSNPVFLLDEIDKLTKNNRGDPASALLEVLDPEQNSTFRDNYLEIPYDLSSVLFLTTANDWDEIPEPLLDRMEIIEMPSYSYSEKFRIAKNYLTEKAIKANGLTRGDVELDDDALYDIINKYTSEAGVRGLEREISKIARKIAFSKGMGGSIARVTRENLAEFLGNKFIIKQEKRDRDDIGCVTGLAWTSGGGDILPIEINTVKGKGDIITTGNLQDIIKESIRVALTYIRSIASKHGIADTMFTKLDYHIHLPETAVPKEGPSAGVGFAAAIYSALTKTAVKNNVAMTGEISLRGNVTAVGGIKEKIMAGFRAGIDVFLIPKDNMRDIEDVPPEITEKIRIYPVAKFDDVLKSGLVFLPKVKAAAPAKAPVKRKIALPEGVDDVIIGTAPRTFDSLS